MSHLLAARSSRRAWLLLLALALALMGLLIQLGGSARGLATLPLHDFVEYWAAGRLNVHGENPYDPERILQLEREAGRGSEGILMWNPPWTLPLVMPLGLLPCRTAHLLWLALHFAVLAWCADALWRLYGGPAAKRGIAWLLAFTFVPSLFTLTAGQIAPLVLLGAVLFLIFLQQGRDKCAGAVLVLLAIKPHLAYLVWLALLLWCLRERRGGVLLGGLLAGVAAVGVALAFNPAVLGQYWHTVTQQPPAQYRSPTLGTLLRLLVGEEHFHLQFWALLPGLAWFGPYWLRHRSRWDWREQLPLLLLVSMLTAAYGAWPFDLVLLLVPVMQVAAGRCREPSGTGLVRLGSPDLRAALVYVAINGLAAVQLAGGMEYLAFVWMTPALLAAYLLLRRRLAADSP
jgi:hypothetical protein